MLGREYLVSAFALIFLIFFCWPILALGYGLTTGAAPSSQWMRIAVGMTNTEIANSVHSLLLPLIGAVIVFRAGDIVSIAGSLLLLVMGVGIVTGFVVFALTNPKILGSAAELKPYVTEYGDVHRSILSMTSMLILLFLTKLGLDPKSEASPADDPPDDDGTQTATLDDPADTPPDTAAKAAMPTGGN